VEQPAKPPAAPHAARPVGHRRARDEPILETLMIPLAMIVLDELCDSVPEVRLPIGVMRSRHSSLIDLMNRSA
jgi:hypothetical protein